MILTPEYLAGLFDGEGWVSLRESKNRCGTPTCIVQVGIGMTHPIVVEISKMFGIKCRFERARREGHKDMFHFVIGSRSGVRRFLHFVLPHLIVKKAQAEAMLKYIIDVPGTMGKKRTDQQLATFREACNKMRELNHGHS